MYTPDVFTNPYPLIYSAPQTPNEDEYQKVDLGVDKINKHT